MSLGLYTIEPSAADDDGFVCRDGDFDNFGGSRRLSKYETGRTLGPGEISRTIFTAARRRRFDVHDHRRHAVGQHRRQRRFTRE